MNNVNSHWKVLQEGAIVVSDTPEQLWDNACKYFEWCDNNPIKNKRMLTSGKNAGDEKDATSTRPYVLEALCVHCGITVEYIRDVRNTKDTSSLWYIIVMRILYIIYIQNTEMAIIGVFNPIFTSKIINSGGGEGGNKTITIKHVQGLPELSTSESDFSENELAVNSVIESTTEQFRK